MAKKSKQSYEEIRKNLLQERLPDRNTCQHPTSEFWDLMRQCLEDLEKIEEPPF